MPIHRYILFDSASGAHHCAQESTTRVDLVQDAIVKYGSTYVDSITVVYSPDPSGAPPPSTSFTLIFVRTVSSYIITPITPNNDPIDIEGSNGSEWSMSTSSDAYTVVFTAPSSSGTRLFEFGDSSGPPTKVTVKIKHQPTTYSC